SSSRHRSGYPSSANAAGAPPARSTASPHDQRGANDADRAVTLRRRQRSSEQSFAHLSDEALIALITRADASALAELYDRYSSSAYGLALRIVRDSQLAEDAVHEAFLAIWCNAGHFRREQIRRTTPLPAIPKATGESVADAVWLRLERERVQAALAQLPDQQREVLELAYYGGFTQTQLAERLGRPLGTIKSQMLAGLSQLRATLADTQPDRQRTPQ